MTHIFVSHASEDKPRLGPFLDRLLLELPDHVSLWIDRPADPNLVRGQVFSFDHPRVKGIRVGETWDAAIESAITQAVGVVAFWSIAAVAGAKMVLRDEITTARDQGKLVPVALDRDAIQWFWFKNQLELVDGEDGPAKFTRAIESLRRLLEGKPVDEGRRGSGDEVDRLPYRVDRTHHVRQICGWAGTRLGPQGEGETARPLVRRAVFVVPCTDQDALDELVGRIVSRDGPDYCGLDADNTPPTWREHLIEWPSHNRKEQVVAGIAEAMQSPDARRQVRTALDFDVPVLFWSQLEASKLHGRPAEFVAKWAEAWSDTTIQQLPLMQEVGRHRRKVLTVVALLFVIGVPCRRFILWKGTTPDLDKICYSVKRYLGKGHPEPRRLEPITMRHATSWLASAEMKALARLKRISLEDLKDEISLIFGRRREMPLQSFVSSLKTATTWKTARGVRPLHERTGERS